MFLAPLPLTFSNPSIEKKKKKKLEQVNERENKKMADEIFGHLLLHGKMIDIKFKSSSKEQ